MIVKYKLVNGMIPTNIVDGGYFVQGDYLIGKGIDLGHEILTKAQLIQQVLQQHQKQPYKHFENNIELTEQEIVDMVNAWCEEREEV